MKCKLRIIAKHRRSKLILNNLQKLNFLENFKYCLQKIISNGFDVNIIGLYYPIYNEISPLEFLKFINSCKIKTALPVVDINFKSLTFKEWKQSEKLQKGLLGNLEPYKKHITVNPQIILVPILMFDKNFYRLGYGGGYYDKFILNSRKNFFKKKPTFLTIGLAYSEQETKNLPYDNHDQKLDYIITEKKIFKRQIYT